MKEFKPTEKLYISKNCNSKTLEDMAEYLKCKPNEVKYCFETMKLNGEYDKYRVSNYETVKKEEEQMELKNKIAHTKSLVDLNQVLFKQLETLNDTSLEQEQFNKEIAKTQAIVSVSQTIINNAKILLEADKHFNNQSNFLIKNVLAIEGETDDIQ